jgi:hypothetical protein
MGAVMTPPTPTTPRGEANSSFELRLHFHFVNDNASCVGDVDVVSSSLRTPYTLTLFHRPRTNAGTIEVFPHLFCGLFNYAVSISDVQRRQISNKINVFVLDQNVYDLFPIKGVCIKSLSFHAC